MINVDKTVTTDKISETAVTDTVVSYNPSQNYIFKEDFWLKKQPCRTGSKWRNTETGDIVEITGYKISPSKTPMVEYKYISNVDHSTAWKNMIDHTTDYMFGVCADTDDFLWVHTEVKEGKIWVDIPKGGALINNELEIVKVDKHWEYLPKVVKDVYVEKQLAAIAAADRIAKEIDNKILETLKIKFKDDVVKLADPIIALDAYKK